ncbi:MAG: ABC transporter ATP-binding protein [Ferroplasma sp.]|uniref:ABC transporter ATP-binding protein n=1 Tax=Ferroplasma sp. TaxID=2591003 RepID=UPI0028152253|nr:ABC transporter ATP-binding protein [Ferroplasma sp.]WMT51959.1 MAG: ABC transporter ATP-binding protein [Ferroplasma sp.]
MITLNKYFIRLIREVLSYRRNSSIIVGSILASSLIAMIGPYLIGIATDSIIALKFRILIFLAAGYLAIYLANYAAENRRTKYMMNTSQEVIKNLRNRAFKKLQYVPLKYYSGKNAGQIISRITNDAETLSDFLTFQLPQVVAGIAGIIASIIIMVYLDPVLTLYAVIIIPMLLATILLMNKKIKFNYINVRRRIAELTGNVGESINGIKAIKSSGTEDVFNNNFESVNSRNYDANVRAVRLTSIFSSIVQVIEGLGIMIVLYEGGSEVFGRVISIGILVSFIVYVQSFFNPIVQLSQFYNSYQSSSIAIERIYKIIDEDVDYNTGGNKLPVFKNKISFENVSFAYDRERIINNISMDIRKGEKIAIIGKTGAGKTTLSGLILNFYKPTSGCITMDGVDINNFNTLEYRKLFGVILQDPFLFEGSILENVRFASPDIPEHTINAKMEELGLAAILGPLGLDYEVGERGTNLSEGQRQAVSILRAAVNNPQIIIMDEATSQLDLKNEGIIQNAIFRFMDGKTIIIIAHHLETIVNSDYIYYIDHGSILEEGTPEDLMNRGTRFYDLYLKNKLLI